MANTKISALTATTTPTWSEEFVYAYNNANGKITLDTMKTFVGWAGITTLNADANIWELTDWMYKTDYDLYYKTGEKISVTWATGAVNTQMLFVETNSEWVKWFFVFNSWSKTASSLYTWYAAFGYSASSSVWECYLLGSRDYLYKQAYFENPQAIDAIQWTEITQIITNINWSGTQDLRTNPSVPLYEWITYTIYVASVGSAYDITLWTWITNPFGITLPTNSSKKCLITVLATSTTTGIVTWCTIEP